MPDADHNSAVPRDAEDARVVPAEDVLAGDTVSLRVVDTTQTVLTALILAFIFRTFMIEAFIIPTGSMATALLGVHSTQVCPRCGLEFDYALTAGRGTHADTLQVPDTLVCPNCHLQTTMGDGAGVLTKSGDRILVEKWPFALGGLFGPNRWDVIIFRDPANPSQNFVKRLVGLPGEEVEIVLGDLFVNGRIARKPASVQSAVWHVVADQRHAPLRDSTQRADRPWVAVNAAGEPGWHGLHSRVIHYDGLDQEPRALEFNPARPIRDVSGFNSDTGHDLVGDMRVVAEITLREGDGWLRWELMRGTTLFQIDIHVDGTCSLRMRETETAQPWRTIAAKTHAVLRADHPVVVEFAHVDYRVSLRVDGTDVLATTDTSYAPDLEQIRRQPAITAVDVRLIASSLAFDVAGLRVDRDVYYTFRAGDTRRAYAGRAMRLGTEDYFVLGDNSRFSHDSREWTDVSGEVLSHYRRLYGSASADAYETGTVRRDLIVGRASFVYLPALLSIDRAGRWRIPDVGEMRFVR